MGGREDGWGREDVNKNIVRTWTCICLAGAVAIKTQRILHSKIGFWHKST